VKLIDSLSAKALGDLIPMVMAGLALAFSTFLKWATGATFGWADAAGIVVAMGVAWGCDSLVATRGARRCFICKRPVEGTSFNCPRCHQVTCSLPSCWAARHFRCRYCDEREVIIFPIEEKWWQQRLGPRASAGSCSTCYKEAGETDLRECRQCGWTMCKRCWDYHNGQCSHCEWIVPDLPAALNAFIGRRGTAPGGAARAERRPS
jgi:hypothetical protein